MPVVLNLPEDPFEGASACPPVPAPLALNASLPQIINKLNEVIASVQAHHEAVIALRIFT